MKWGNVLHNYLCCHTYYFLLYNEKADEKPKKTEPNRGNTRDDPLLLLPLLPCLCSHSPTLVHVCQLSFTCSCLPAFICPFSFTLRLLSSTALVLVHPPSVVRSPLSTPTGCLACHLPTASLRPSHSSLAPHACAPAIRGCTGSFIHVRSCRSGACSV